MDEAVVRVAADTGPVQAAVSPPADPSLGARGGPPHGVRRPQPGRAGTAGEERTVWLATAAYAGLVGMLLILLGRGEMNDPETLGGIAGGVLAVVLLAYSFRGAFPARLAALTGTASGPGRGWLVVFALLSGITLAFVIVGAVTG